ncbi:MAG: Na/Pi cotransporter family protein [Clostridia bacterium]|nr:Na/Pi cotransporter family protein [Clostridia bacterium]
MTVFDVLTMLGSMCLFLFGMQVMGDALERRAGSGLRSILAKLTTGRVAGLATGLGVTSVIQSSAATTVMVVGFVNSGLMTLKQAINVIMGANIGTTVTAWILSLSGISSDNPVVMMLKPSSFVPILALLGIVLFMFTKKSTSKETGTILLGFAVMMFGMNTMTDMSSKLAEDPMVLGALESMFSLFANPLIGVVVGALITAAIQSSSASVGMLQMLSATGAVTYGAAIPMIMGQNIGTCITAMISSVGTNKNAKRAAMVHLCFNVIGTIVWLVVFVLVRWLISPALLSASADGVGIAICHSIFNILCTILMLPLSGLLEKLVIKLVPGDASEKTVKIDERLLATPPLALGRCRELAIEMAKESGVTMQQALGMIHEFNQETMDEIRSHEKRTDQYEDELGSYLVKLSACQLTEKDSSEAAKLLRLIGDFERIADHAVNISQSSEEMKSRMMTLSGRAKEELSVMIAAVNEIQDLSMKAFVENDLETAYAVEPLEQVINRLKTKLRARHIERLQQGNCSIEAGFVWSDLITDLERVADHCSNIAGCVIDMAHNDMNLHESLRATRHDDPHYQELFQTYHVKYSV